MASQKAMPPQRPSTDSANPPSSFDDVRERILGAIEQWPSSRDSQENVPRLALYEEQHLLEELYDAAQVNDSVLTRNKFKDAVRGDGEEKSCVKVLATLLSAGVGPDTTSWKQFLEGLKLASTGHEMRFCDKQMPFSWKEIKDTFGDAEIDSIRAFQFAFCPFDITSQFADLRKKLEDAFTVTDPAKAAIINGERKVFCIKCKVDDEAAKDTLPQVNTFVPEYALHQVAELYHDTIKGLYIEALKAEANFRTLPDRLKWTKFRQHQKDAIRFFAGAETRMKAFGTLVVSKCDPGPETSMWETFSRICMNSEPALEDKSFPLSWKNIEETFPPEHNDIESFFGKQYRFCAVKIERNQMVRTTGGQYHQRLPLAEKFFLGSGAYGHVFRVKIKAGYYSNTGKDKVVAMKRLTLAADDDEKSEWRFAEWLFQQQREDKCIMRALAGVMTQDQMYIFFPLARCDLHQYMHNSLNDPKTDEERRTLFNLFIGLTEALDYLHNHMRGEGRRRMVCIHEDLRAANILVVDYDGQRRWQIADFGVSRIKRQNDLSNPDESSWPELKRKSKFMPETSSSSSTSSHWTPQRVNSLAPHCPPEKEVTTGMDVWSLGVLFAEFIAWVSGGTDALLEFEGVRNDVDASDYHSYQTVRAVGTGRKHYPIKEGIRTWFASLLARVRESGDRELCNLYDWSWWVLQHRMLVGDLTRRAKTATILEDLIKIHGRTDPTGRATSRSVVAERALTLRQIQTYPWPSSPLKDSAEGSRRSSVGNAGPQTNRDSPRSVISSGQGPSSAQRNQPHNANGSPPDHLIKSDLVASPQSASPTPDVTANRLPMVRPELRSKLLEAIEAANDHESTALLKRGADWQTVDEHGQSCLYYAAAKGMSSAVREMLKTAQAQSDADGHSCCAVVDAKDTTDWQYTALMYAISEGQSETALQLIEYGADVTVQDTSKRNSLHLAVRYGSSMKLITTLIDRCPALIRSQDECRETPLHLCACSSNKFVIECVEEFLSRDETAILVQQRPGKSMVDKAPKGSKMRQVLEAKLVELRRKGIHDGGSIDHRA